MGNDEMSEYKNLVRRFEYVYGCLADLMSGLKRQGDYQVAGYVERAMRALDDAISDVLADCASARNPEPFGTYVERDDGTSEFRRTGEPHTPTAQGYKVWRLYSDPVATCGSSIIGTVENDTPVHRSSMMIGATNELFHRLRAAFIWGAQYMAQKQSCTPGELDKAAEDYAREIGYLLAMSPSPLKAREGWRPHDGLLDPDVAGDTLVEVCFRDGETAFGVVHQWGQNWQWADSQCGLTAPGAIIAWRPHRPSRAASEKCPHCAGTGDVSAKGRIEECLACNGKGRPESKLIRWEVRRPSDGEWVRVSQGEARCLEDLGMVVRALYPRPESQRGATE